MVMTPTQDRMKKVSKHEALHFFRGPPRAGGPRCRQLLRQARQDGLATEYPELRRVCSDGAWMA